MMILIKLFWLLILLALDVCTTVAEKDVEITTLYAGTMQVQYKHENGTMETVPCPRYFVTLPATSVQAEIKYKLEHERWSDRVILDLLYYSLQHGSVSGGSSNNNKNTSSTQKQQIQWDILQRSENSHCKWEGITCNKKNEVIQIVVFGLGVSGTLPHELHQMSQLERFNVRNNKIQGTLPASYGSMSNLRLFNAQRNEISGSIPESYRGMINITSFFLSDNSLTGTVSSTVLHDWKKLMHLDLSRNCFEGPLPVGLFEDKLQLFNVSLSHNALTGTFPAILTKLEGLKLLDLNNNKLTGQLPRLEDSAPNLIELKIGSNQLTGTIPTEILLLSKIQKLELGDNLLTGTLPRGDDVVDRLEAVPTGGKWGDIKALKHLDLRSNQLSGTIPAQLAVGLSRLTKLDLGFNFLEGTLPTTFGLMKRLQFLLLPYNNLEGSIPVELVNTSKLLKFNFTENRFTYLPTAICDRADITKETIYFYLMGCNVFMCERGSFTLNGAQDMYTNCQFCKGLKGPEADYIGRATCPTQKFLYGDLNMDNDLSEIEILRLFHTSTGGLHWGKKYESWGMPTGDACILPGVTCKDKIHVSKIELTEVLMCGDFGRNRLDDDECHGIPSELALLTHLEFLNLGKQRYLRGTIPWELGHLTNLKHWEITSAREMKGTLPSTIGLLTNLKVLNLSGCKYNGTIPEEIYQLTNLEKLHLNMNMFTGPISSNISNMTNLKEFMMSRTYLSSSIPEELGQLTTIENLELYGNLLTGSIPASIGNCTNLKRMDLFNNQLTGTLPDSLSKLESLQILHLKLNQLTGTIPSHFGELPFLSWFDVSSNQLHGTIPKTFGNSRNLQDFRVGNNRIYAPIPPSLCRNVNINGGIVTTYGCDGVICPLGTYSETGHAMEAKDGCLPCPEGETTMYLGASKCEVITDHDILTMFYDVLLHDLDRKEQKLMNNEMGGGLYKESMMNNHGADEQADGDKGGRERYTESSHWSWKDPSAGVCEWKGVRCNSKGEILSFRFPTPDMDG